MKTKTQRIETEIADLMQEVERLADRLAHALGSARERVGAVEKPVREQLASAEAAIEERVQQRPLGSVLLAFVAGFALSTFLWR